MIVSYLILKERESDEHVIFKNEAEGNMFHFNLCLTDLKSIINEEKNFDLFVSISYEESNLSAKQIKTLNKKNYEVTRTNEGVIYSKEVRLGKFEKTYIDNFKEIRANGQTYRMYVTIKGNISIAVNKEFNQPITTQIDRLKIKRNHISLNGKIYTKSRKIEGLSCIIKGRTTGKEIIKTVSLELLQKMKEKRYGLNRYKYSIDLDLKENKVRGFFSEDTYDLFLQINFEEEPTFHLVRLKKPRVAARLKLKHARIFKDNDTYILSPYYTFRAKGLSIVVNKMNKENYKYLLRQMRWAFLLNKFNRKDDLWLIGERITTAQDTGYHLFKYIRGNYPNKNVYYVIDSDSADLDRVERLGNIIYKGTKEHIQAVINASKIIGSHHPEYLYPLGTREFKNKVYGQKVFLQHGVLGTKNMQANYGKQTEGFHTNLFFVSSDFEKEIVVNDLGYKPEEVEVTGLSRYDTLFKKDVAKERQILIIPTWREWLFREDLFIESEYLKRYRDLIQSKVLENLAKKYKFKVLLYLHVNMKEYIHFFNSSFVKIIDPKDVDVQTLIKESSLMVTDYSSVGFDFSFLKKPVLYYQFDKKRFIGKNGSHLDIENDLPGDILYEEEDLIDCIEAYAKSNFTMSKENENKASKFIKINDESFSERIYKTLQQNNKRTTSIDRLLNSEFYRAAFRRFRRSKYYFKFMKIFYFLCKKFISVDEELILFESNLGKHYADSPKVIYEHLVENDYNYKYVWVCNQRVRFKDVNTKRIKRLSPSYYYYLAKAKYWVNNQNFPTYIKKRKETTYLQTWHGTPLKRMLNDLEEAIGRTDDYVARVTRAIKDWDYLVSPSEYATEKFKSAFKFSNQIIEEGYPRNDIFNQPSYSDVSEKIRSRLGINSNKKIVLYAPTFRDNQTSKTNKFSFELELDLFRMQEELGEEYIVLLRMHVVIANKIHIDEELEDFVMDVSGYSDMQELLLITDILITDYSSVMFDFANTRRPMLFYTYDLELYRDDVRGFYVNFEEEAPGPLVKTTEEVINSIQNISFLKTKYEDSYNAFVNKYCYLEDGKATKRIVRRVFGV